MTDKPEAIQLRPDEFVYPAGLSAAFGAKAPVLYAMGNIALLDRPGIGFCGSRKASEIGLETAADCAEQAARAGYVVVSGNAAGVDFVAHHAALDAGGATILVLPEGIDHFRIRKDLQASWDWQRTLVVSQFEPKAVWQGFRAMSRNETIIALSRVMIVIEAGPKGGTLGAGLSTLAVGKPLFVAVYEKMDVTAPGNAQLLSRGGLKLAKSKTTGKAKLEQILLAASPAPATMKLRKQSIEQLSLL